MRSDCEIAGQDFDVRIDAASSEIITLDVDGSPRMAVGRVKCGDFDENSSLCGKFRVHRSGDMLSASVDSENVLPFGCEYLVRREIRCSDGIMRLSDDISAMNGGKVGSVGLEPVSFLGDISAAELEFEDGSVRKFEKATGEIYRGTELPLRLAVSWADGVRCEYACGFDVWRHRTAAADGVSCEFSLGYSNGALVLERRPVICADETTSDRRSCRYVSLFSWMGRSPAGIGGEADAARTPEVVELGGCPLSGAFRRSLRHAVRRVESDMVLRCDRPGVCDNAAHLARRSDRRMPHYGLSEYADDYCWASGALAGRGLHFTLEADGDGVALERMRRPLRMLKPGDGQ